MSGTQPGVVTFDYSTWVLRYPEFQQISAPLAQLYFNEATLYCDNSPCSQLACNPTALAMFLNMITAHIAALNNANTATGSSPLVGRVSSASEGSVSVSTELNVPGGAAWFAQTKYGLAYWQASAAYRLGGFYTPGPQRRFNPPGPGWLTWNGGGWGS
jgi:hypothetical protein